MALTVEEALTLKAFRDAKLVSGEKGLKNEITWVNILEILDDLEHLQKGEFLITTAYGLEEKDAAYQEKIVKTLSRKQLSAIAVQTGYYVKNIPQHLKEVSKNEGLPLIELPHHASFSDITRAILERLTSKESDLFEFSEKINQELTDALLKQMGIQGIAMILYKLTHHPVRILNNWYQPVAWAGTEPSPSTLEREFLHLKKKGLWETLNYVSKPVEVPGLPDIKLPDQLIIPIRSRGEIHGYISMLKKGMEFGQKEVFALNRASSLCALELTKKQNRLKSKIKLTSDFIKKIIDENIPKEYLKQNADFLGFSDVGKCCCLVIEVEKKQDFDKLYRITNLVELTLKSKNKKTLCGVYEDKIVCIISVEKSDMKKVLNLVTHTREELKKYFSPLHIDFGLGNCYNGLSQLHKSYHEAIKVLNFNKKSKGAKKLYYKNLGIFRLLMEIDANILNDFYKDTLLPVIQYDKTHSMDLVKTLEVFLATNNLKKTADILFLHRHTVRYRLNKIKKLTNLDPFNQEDQKTLYIALLISDMLQ